MPAPPGRPRYRFSGHTLSPARRTLVRDGRELPLIPRCFDLLVLLVEHRNEALSRNDILDAVWSDVAVSDGALSQAVRVLRRALGDDPREPTFIRTVPRHGYRFVCDVVEEPDDAPPEPRGAVTEPVPAPTAAAEPGRVRAAAEPVPAATAEPGPAVAAELRRVARLTGRRWVAAAAGGAAAGAVAGLLGGLVLRFGPGSTAGNGVLPMLPLLGTAIGGVAAAGVGAGLAGAEAAFRAWRRLGACAAERQRSAYRGASSWDGGGWGRPGACDGLAALARRSSPAAPLGAQPNPSGVRAVLGRRLLALAVAGAASGLAVGGSAHLLGRLVLEGVFGRDLSPLTGAVEGLVLGGAVGLGYGLATPTADGGMATPQGLARVRVALLTGLACALAAGMLGWSGRFLGAMSLDFMAQSFPGSEVGLTPLARLLGEPEPGVVTRVAISTFEGLMFGSGLAAGLTRRPR